MILKNIEVEGLPEGLSLVRIGYAKKGELYIGQDGVTKAYMDHLNKIHIIVRMDDVALSKTFFPSLKSGRWVYETITDSLFVSTHEPDMVSGYYTATANPHFELGTLPCELPDWVERPFKFKVNHGA